MKLSFAFAVGVMLSGHLFAYGQPVKASGFAEHRLHLTENSSHMNYNGETMVANQPITSKKGTVYVPLKSIAKLYGFSLSRDPHTKATIVKKNRLSIYFTPNTRSIRVNGKRVFATNSPYIQEGSLMIPLRTWIDLTNSQLHVSGLSHTLTWNPDFVQHFTPVADFVTDKTIYRIGENIQYDDLSYDKSNSIVKRTWTGKSHAFFEPGEYPITLEIENKYGFTDAITRTVSISDEALYSPEEHGLLFAEPGKKLEINGDKVLSYDPVVYDVDSQAMTFIRSNSPEHLYGEEGIGYRDKVTGDFRINIHNQNRSQKDLKVYLLATNHGSTQATLTLKSFGKGGPTKYVSTSGKTAVSRFLSSLTSSTPVQTSVVRAGETTIVLPDVGKEILKPGLTMTSYSEIYTDQELEFSVVILAPGKNPITYLPQLRDLKRDGRHVRGTFLEGNRTLEVSRILGEQPERLIIGDDDHDDYIMGKDSVTQQEEINIGNTGVLYNMQLQVAPRTAIVLNARGKHYAGAFLVNNQVINMLDDSILINSDEAGMLYRTGNLEETVTISYVLASGSNLPLYMLFLPIPEGVE